MGIAASEEFGRRAAARVNDQPDQPGRACVDRESRSTPGATTNRHCACPAPTRLVVTAAEHELVTQRDCDGGEGQRELDEFV
jgi:hypothetical protein